MVEVTGINNWILYRHRFHEVMAQRALMRAVPSLRENGNDIIQSFTVNIEIDISYFSINFKIRRKKINL